MGKGKQEKWDRRFLELAKHISTWSKDPSTKVGSVIATKKFRFVSAGFNGLPQDLKDVDERLNNRDLKLKMFLHAEDNAILFANRKLKKCTIYVYPFMPCSNCAARIIQKKIKRVVAPVNDCERWAESFRITKEMFEEAGVELVLMNNI